MARVRVLGREVAEEDAEEAVERRVRIWRAIGRAGPDIVAERTKWSGRCWNASSLCLVVKVFEC